MADTVLPLLDSISVSGVETDETTGVTTLFVDLAAHDVDSGVASIEVTFADPDGGTYSGTLLGEAGQLNIEIPAGSPTGTYTAVQVNVTDNAGLVRTYEGENLESLLVHDFTVQLGEEDITPPAIADLSVSDPVVDYATGDQAVTYNLHITDNLAGVKEIRPFFYDENGDNVVIATLSGDDIATLTADPGQDIITSLTFHMPDHLENGTYRIGLKLVDHADNQTTYYPDEIAEAGFDGSHQVVNSIEDVTPPELTAFSIDDVRYDEETGDTYVTVSATIEDDIAGVRHFDVHLNYDGKRYYYERSWTPEAAQPSYSGTLEFRIPNYYPNGEFNFSLWTRDNAANPVRLKAEDIEALGFNPRFSVDTNNPDFDAPTLADLQIVDGSVDVESGDTSVSLQVTLDETHSGVARFYVKLTSPSGQEVEVRVDGTNSSLVTIDIPENFTSGAFTISLRGWDNAQNKFSYTYEQIEELGFNASFDLTEPPAETPPAEEPPAEEPPAEEPPAEEPPAEEPPADNDKDNGHGNDADGVDESNPGNSTGTQKGGRPDKPSKPNDDNGHGNDDDGVDESNPGNSTGTQKGGRADKPSDSTEEPPAEEPPAEEPPADDDHDNGHGNDDDGVDESNPGNSTGTQKGGKSDKSESGRNTGNKPKKGSRETEEDADSFQFSEQGSNQLAEDDFIMPTDSDFSLNENTDLVNVMDPIDTQMDVSHIPHPTDYDF